MSEIDNEISRLFDGDTFQTDDGTVHRLQHVDAIEKNQPGGAQATQLLQDLFDEGADVYRSGEQGHYGRELSDVMTSRGVPASAELAYQGLAQPYRGDEFGRAARDAGNRDLALNGRGPDEELAELFRQSVYAEGARPGSQDIRSKSTFAQSLARGSNNLEASLYGFGKALGDLTGIDYLSERGLEGMERNIREAMINPAQISSVDDVDSLDDAWTFVVESLGEQLPQLLGDAAAAVLGAGAGGIAARRGAMKALQREFGPKFTEAVRKGKSATLTDKYQTLREQRASASVSQATKQGAVTGARAGTFASLYPQSVGETAMNFEAEGIDAPGLAFATGAAKAALDYAPLETLVRGLSRATGTGARGLGQSASRVMQMAGLEATTEGVQTTLDFMARNHAQGRELTDFSPEDLEELRTAVAKGGIVGGGLAGTGEVAVNTPDMLRQIPGAYRAARARVASLQRQRSAQQPAEQPAEADLSPDMRDFTEQLNFRLQGGYETTEEGPEALKAQAWAFGKGLKPGLFASANDRASYGEVNQAAKAAGLEAIDLPEGLLVTRTEFDAEAYRQASPEQRDLMRARALGYTQAKAELQDPDTAVVVQTRSPKGAILHQELVDGVRANEVRDKQRSMFQSLEGASTEITSAQQVQAERPGGEQAVQQSLFPETEGQVEERQAADAAGQADLFAPQPAPAQPAAVESEPDAQAELPGIPAHAEHILKRGGTPYANTRTAQAKANQLNKQGGDHRVVQVEGGFAVIDAAPVPLESIPLEDYGSKEVEVEETGELVEVPLTASDIITDIDKRLAVAEKLLRCVGG